MRNAEEKSIETSESLDEKKETSSEQLDLVLKIEEDQRQKFGVKHPFRVIIEQSFGQWVFTVLQAIQDTISAFFMSKAYPEENISSAISSILFLRTFITAFTSFFRNGITVQLTRFLSMHELDKAAQLSVDCVRLNIIASLVVLIIIVCAGRPLLTALNIPDSYQDLCYYYLVTSSAELIFNGIFDFGNSMLQGEGKATLGSIFQTGSFIISCLIADPLFMFVFKVPTWALGFAANLGDVILSFVLTPLFLVGMFNTKPTLKMFLKPFRPETLVALKVGVLPFCIVVLALIPALCIQSLINGKAKEAGVQTAVSSVLGLGMKIVTIISNASIGAFSGLISSSSWAAQKGLWSRVRQLVIYSWPLAALSLVIVCPIMWFSPRTIIKIWTKNEVALQIADIILRPYSYLLILLTFYQSFMYAVISTTKSILAVTPLLFKFVTLMVSAYVIAATTNTYKYITYSYTLGDFVAFVASLIMFRTVGKKIWFGKDDVDAEEQAEERQIEEL